MIDNIPRILPAKCQAVIHKESFHIPPIFAFIQKNGNISEVEMLRTFNNGIGMVLLVPQKEAKDITLRLQNMHLKSYIIGKVVERKRDEKAVIFV